LESARIVGHPEVIRFIRDSERGSSPAFRPDTEGAAGKYHKLKARLTAGNGEYVQTRPGYFAPAAAAAEAKTETRRLDQQALGRTSWRRSRFR
jgi:hypothetical protein